MLKADRWAKTAGSPFENRKCKCHASPLASKGQALEDLCDSAARAYSSFHLRCTSSSYERAPNERQENKAEIQLSQLHCGAVDYIIGLYKYISSVAWSLFQLLDVSMCSSVLLGTSQGLS